ncbi:MAG: PspA/IM30 family protein [Anaerolineae bacterium]
MASLSERVGTLVSANLNWLVTQALKANSMAVVDEYIRRAEDNLEALEDAAATVGGEVKTLRRKQAEYEAKAAELDRNIDLLLQQNKEQLAVAAQSRHNTLKRLAESYRQQGDAQEIEYKRLLDARLKLEAKLTEIRQERVELQAKLELARSKEMSHRAMQNLSGTTNVEDGLAAIREEIQKRLDKAAARGEIDASRLDSQMSEVLEEHTIKLQLEERRKRLGLAS